jgi:hypothetical protein
MAIQIAGNQIKSGAVDTTQIADNSIDANKLDLSQNYTFSGNVAGITPTANGHFTTKQYVDGIVGNGVFWKEPCEVATTGNVNLSNPATSTFDNVTISSGQRVLVRAQSDASQNGLYDFNGASSAMTRSADADSASELQTAAVFVNRGDTYSDQAFVETQSITTLGSDDVEFVRFSGLGMVSAGTALSKQGDTLNVQVDDVAIEVNGSDQLQLKDLGIVDGKIANSTISAGKLAGSIPDSKLNQITTAAKVAGSAVQLNGSGGLANSSGLKIDDLGVTAGMLAGSVPDTKLNQITTADKVAGSAVQLASGGGLADDTGLKIDTNGIETAMIGNLQVTNGKLAGSIADSKLNTITSANKVSGSAVQLNAAGGLEDSTGLQIAAGGVSAAMLAGSVPDSKLLQITSAAKVAGSAVQLAASGGLENASGLKVEDDGIVQAMISDNAVSAAKINFEPTRETLSTNGNTTAFNLSNSLPDNFDDVLVFRNGLLAERVASNPADEDQYTSSISAGTCTVTFGSAPASSDKVIVAYFQIKS